MWSVHTRNETTSRRCTPTCRLARARPAGRGGGPSSAESTGRKAGERGPQGARVDSRRLALYGSRIGVGDVGALRLLQCALYSPTLKESHALTSSSSTRRGGPQREESVRERFTRRPPSERSRANEPPGNERPGHARAGSFLVK